MQVGDLGRLGVWTWLDHLAAGEAAEFANQLEDWGYGALWIPEAVGRDPFSLLGYLAAKTDRLILATGIANIYARDAHASVSARNTLAEQSGGRFLLGLGVSHAPMVEQVRGHRYTGPVATMRAYLDTMEKAPYSAIPPSETPPTVIAALGPKMLALAAEKTTGAHPYLVPPEHTARARETLGPRPWLCTEQKVLLETNPSRAREVARKALGIYLRLPNYRNNLKRLGYTDADMDDGGIDRLVEEYGVGCSST